MAKRRVVIEISPSRLEVARIEGGRIALAKGERLSIPNFTEDWPGALAALAPRLHAMVTALDAEGAEATILYSSPTAATGLFSCPLSAGRAQAARAAALALAEAADFPLAANPSDLAGLATDRAGRAGDNKVQQIHTLGLADTDACTQALVDWAAASGLRPIRLVPADAVSIIAATDLALELSAAEGAAVVLHVSDHGSVLAAATAGRLRFVRQLAIGVETFVDAMASRPAEGVERVGPYNSAGSELTFGLGIPTREQALRDGPGSQTATILPAVQPILQRCIVDLKQSLRFGLEEQERKGARLVGIGPGAAIPRLLGIISEQTDLTLDPQRPAAASPGAAPSPGAIPEWLTLRPLDINLLPRALDLELTTRRVTRGLWAGFAAAGVLVAAGATMTRSDLAHERHENQITRERLGKVKPALDLGTRLSTAQAGLASAKLRVGARMGETAAWDAAMAMLATNTPPEIKLTEAVFSIVQGQPTCKLIGYTSLTAQADANASLKAYLDALSTVPLVRTCRLGATQRSQSGDGAARQSFEATLVLVEFPADPSDPARNMTSVTPGDEAR